MHLHLFSKIDKLTKTILFVYFHETRVIKAMRVNNQKSQLKALIVFTSGKSIAHKNALDKGFNFP